MLSVLHRIAIAQALPEAVDNSHGDRERIMQLARQMPSEDVQLFYQTALLGRRDLPLAPDPRAGFEMVLLRMLAFKPQGVIDVPNRSLPASQPDAASQPVAAVAPSAPTQLAPAPNPAAQPAPVAPASQPPQPVIASPAPAATPAPMAAPAPEPEPAAPAAQEPPPFDAPYDNAPDNLGEDYNEYAPPPAYFEASYEPAPAAADAGVPEPKKSEAAALLPVVEPVPVPQLPPELPVPPSLRKVPYEQAGPQDWPEIYLGLGVTGILQSTAANCQLVGRQGSEFQFILDDSNSTLYDPSHQGRLADLLSNYFIERCSVKIQLGKVTAETPSMIAQRLKIERQAHAVASIKADPIVLQLIEHFDAVLREETIEPV
jgi:DNA polymerase III subunit gamma/tau